MSAYWFLQGQWISLQLEKEVPLILLFPCRTIVCTWSATRAKVFFVQSDIPRSCNPHHLGCWEPTAQECKVSLLTGILQNERYSVSLLLSNHCSSVLINTVHTSSLSMPLVRGLTSPSSAAASSIMCRLLCMYSLDNKLFQAYTGFMMVWFISQFVMDG